MHIIYIYIDLYRCMDKLSQSGAEYREILFISQPKSWFWMFWMFWHVLAQRPSKRCEQASKRPWHGNLALYFAGQSGWGNGMKRNETGGHEVEERGLCMCCIVLLYSDILCIFDAWEVQWRWYGRGSQSAAPFGIWHDHFARRVCSDSSQTGPYNAQRWSGGQRA